MPEYDEQRSPRASKWGQHVPGTNLPTYDDRGRVVLDTKPSGFRPDNTGPRRGKAAIPARDRFVKKYKIHKKTGCWLWQGKLNKWGKSTFYDGEKNVDPQEYSWLLATGKEPAGTLQRTCETKGCVNPDHLQEMKWRKHRRTQSALTVTQVLKIRRLFDKGIGVSRIAKDPDFEDVSESSVGMAARRKSYKWIPEE